MNLIRVIVVDENLAAAGGPDAPRDARKQALVSPSRIGHVRTRCVSTSGFHPTDTHPFRSSCLCSRSCRLSFCAISFFFDFFFHKVGAGSDSNRQLARARRLVRARQSLRLHASILFIVFPRSYVNVKPSWKLFT